MTLGVLFVFLGLLIGAGASYDYCQASMPSPALREDAAGDSLKLLVVTIRHGDRTPVYTMPNGYTDSVVWDCELNSVEMFDTTLDNSLAPKRLYRKTYLDGREILPGDCMFGQLTEKGSQQHLLLGKTLRQRYVDTLGFLPSKLNLDDLWVRSTDVYRTFQSAQSLLYGLYPPSSSSSPKADNSVAVIQMRTMDNELENMTPNTHLCPRLTEIYEELAKTPQYTDYLTSIQPLQSFVNDLFNTSVYLGGLADELHARDCHAFAWPAGINRTVADMVYDAATFEEAFFINTTEALRLGIGSFIGEQIARVDAFLAGQETQKLVLYSGHDTTIFPLKRAFGYEELLWPPYASNFLLEVWEKKAGALAGAVDARDDDDYYVRVIVNGEERAVPGCGQETVCPYSTFKAALTPLLPTDFAAECALKAPHLLELQPGLRAERNARRSPHVLYSHKRRAF